MEKADGKMGLNLGLGHGGCLENLIQWFRSEGCVAPQGTFCNVWRTHLIVPSVEFGGGSPGVQWVEARDALQRLTVHTTVLTTKNYSKCSEVLLRRCLPSGLEVNSQEAQVTVASWATAGKPCNLSGHLKMRAPLGGN